MRLHEYQAKLRFAEYGIPIPHGKLATTALEAQRIAVEIGQPVFIKPQTLVEEQTNHHGDYTLLTPTDTPLRAETIFNNHGTYTPRILVEPAHQSSATVCLRVAHDRNRALPVMTACELHDNEHTHSHDLPVIEYVDPFLGLRNFQALNLANRMNLPRELWHEFTRIAQALYRCFVDSDAVIAELSPLAITTTNQLMTLGARLEIDDNALPRQPKLAELRDPAAESFAERTARDAGLTYLDLRGKVGCIVNGSGLALATGDALHAYGGDDFGPANFLDIGDSARPEDILTALQIMHDTDRVKAALMNVFCGVRTGDTVARSILLACDSLNFVKPLVVRLSGQNATEGMHRIERAEHAHIHTAVGIRAAALKAVQAAKD